MKISEMSKLLLDLRSMRQAQIAYFDTKNKDDLRTAIGYEKRIDGVLALLDWNKVSRLAKSSH